MNQASTVEDLCKAHGLTGEDRAAVQKGFDPTPRMPSGGDVSSPQTPTAFTSRQAAAPDEPGRRVTPVVSASRRRESSADDSGENW